MGRGRTIFGGTGDCQLFSGLEQAACAVRHSFVPSVFFSIICDVAVHPTLK